MSIEISRPTNPLPTCIPPRMSPQTGNSTALPPLDTMPDDFVLQEESMFSSQPPPVSGQSLSFSPANELSATHPLLCMSDFECRPNIGYAAAVQAQMAGPRAEIPLQDTLPSPFSWNNMWASDNDNQMPALAQVPSNLSYEDAHAKSQQVVDSTPRFNDVMQKFWLPPFTNAWRD